MSVLFTALLVLLLLAVSGFFSMAETALTTASRAKMLTLAQEGNWRAKVVNFLLSKTDRLLAALLLGNNLINILASAITTELMLKLFDKNGIAIATVLMTVLVLIFAEILPKSWALHKPDAIAMAIAPVIRVVLFILSPITSALSWVVRKIAALFGADFEKVKYSISIEELRGAIEMHQGSEQQDNQEDETFRHERAMMRSVLDLAKVTVSEVMTHRRNAEMLDANMSSQDLIDRALASQYSRLPIYQDNLENIVGVIHGKLLMRQLRAMEGKRDDVDILSLVSEPWFIPETTTLFDQLQSFRERREHFAFVVDEYGTWLGIVTLEDILEEIVGQIDDEHDHVVQGVHDDPYGQLGSYVVDGTMTIRDLNREFDWNLPNEDYATVAGLVLYESQAVPEVGQSYIFYGYQFDVLERHRHQITKLRVTPITDESEEG
ncbi:MAG TPA: CNNM domain-containing protein [Alphaproteobacteria bacterium]